MSKYLTQKILAIIILVGLLLIPVGLIMGIIQERKNYQKEVIEKVSESSSGKQQIIAPILAIPYKEIVEKTDPETNKIQRVYRNTTHYVLPQSLSVNSESLDVTPRKVGIYQAQVYATEPKFTGHFGKIDFSDFIKDDTTQIGEPYFIISMSDTRGINKTSNFKLNNEELQFKEGTTDNLLRKGIHVPVSLNSLLSENSNNTFEFKLNIQGTQSFSIVPVGRDSTFSIMKSNWQHPSFIGSISPQSRTITSNGFEANWQSTWFANNINDLFKPEYIDAFSESQIPTFSVDLIETVDQYQLNERAVKYALLFIGLTFVGFIVFEFVAQLRLHPIQYGLVGLTQVLFYLILLAVSEHVGFNVAYIIASVSSVLLISFYLVSVLKGYIRAVGFGAGLSILYGLLFIILQSEDFSLILGTSLLFIVLTIVMLATRKIDWYQLKETSSKKESIKKHRKSLHDIQFRSSDIEDNHHDRFTR